MTESDDAALARFDAQVTALSAAAFAAGCRLAVTRPVRVFDEKTLQYSWTWQHVILSPGESPPPGVGRAWTIFEQRNGMPLGRSA